VSRYTGLLRPAVPVFEDQQSLLRLKGPVVPEETLRGTSLSPKRGKELEPPRRTCCRTFAVGDCVSDDCLDDTLVGVSTDADTPLPVGDPMVLEKSQQPRGAVEDGQEVEDAFTKCSPTATGTDKAPLRDSSIGLFGVPLDFGIATYTFTAWTEASHPGGLFSLHCGVGVGGWGFSSWRASTSSLKATRDRSAVSWLPQTGDFARAR